MNFLLDQADAVTGLSGVFPRMAIPQSPAIVKGGAVTLNNIRVDHSVVGAINTAEVQRIDIALSDIKIGGQEELAAQLRDFTEAVIASTELNREIKDDVLGQVSFLAQQVQAPQKSAPGILKSVASGVAVAISSVNSLVVLWTKLHPLLIHAIGI
jgi:hypothetical protein